MLNKLDLSSLPYLTEEETLIDASMIPLVENTRLGCFIVRLEDLNKLDESYNNALYCISKHNNVDIDNIAVSIKDTDLVFSNLNEQFDRVVIEPTYSDYYYQLMNTIQECVRRRDLTLLEEDKDEDPLPYYTTLKTVKKGKRIIAKKSKNLFKNKKFQLGTLGAFGAYKGYQHIKKNGSPIKAIKEKIAALRMAYHTYKGDYDKALETGYKNPGLIKKILEKIKENIRKLMDMLKRVY